MSTSRRSNFNENHTGGTCVWSWRIINISHEAWWKNIKDREQKQIIIKIDIRENKNRIDHGDRILI